MLKPELVHFLTADGLRLAGLLFEAPQSKKLAIYLHGNGNSSVFYQSGYELAEELAKEGISLLMFNNRGAYLIRKYSIKQDGEEVRRTYGTAYEQIKDCVPDIDAAVEFGKRRKYESLFLIGMSTGANKICVFNHYQPEHQFAKFVLIAGGDDTGLYFDEFGVEKTWSHLHVAKRAIEDGKKDEIMKELLPNELFSYGGFYDITNPDGDYNCFPFSEALMKKNLSKKPLFRYFKEIITPSLVIYGEVDEYAWGNAPACVDILKSYNPYLEYKIIPGGDHRFQEKEGELAREVADYLL
jgi:pimeloyl-ACP methyl ester carboxylesterase